MQEGVETAGHRRAMAAMLGWKAVPGLLKSVPSLLKDKDSSVVAPRAGDEETAEIDAAWTPNENDVRHFTHLVLDRSQYDIGIHFEHLLKTGVLVNTLLLDLLPASARLLGQLWSDDDCSFADVTLGLATIHQLLRWNAMILEFELDPVPDDHAILITPMPGEAHIFAAVLLGEYFRASKWRVYSGINESRETIIRLVEQHSLDVIGLTVSCGEKVDECMQLVSEIRNRSLNGDVRILAGGPPFLENADLYREIGADATAKDAAGALDAARIVCRAEAKIRKRSDSPSPDFHANLS